MKFRCAASMTRAVERRRMSCSASDRAMVSADRRFDDGHPVDEFGMVTADFLRHLVEYGRIEKHVQFVDGFGTVPHAVLTGGHQHRIARLGARPVSAASPPGIDAAGPKQMSRDGVLGGPR